MLVALSTSHCIACVRKGKQACQATPTLQLTSALSWQDLQLQLQHKRISHCGPQTQKPLMNFLKQNLKLNLKLEQSAHDHLA